MLHKILKIFFLSLICLSAKSQSPTGLPTVNSPQGYYNIGWLRSDSGFIMALRDTSVRARFAGTGFMWQHPGADTNVWFNDGLRYFHYLKSGQDVINALGYAPIALNSISATSPIVYNNLTGVISCPTCGSGGGGNIVSLNTLTAANQILVSGSART